VVTASNATNGLVTALQALAVRGKVLTPAYTFPATAQAILMAGCTPKFCDVAEATWELDSTCVEEALQDPEVGAVMHVRAYGFGHDLAWLERMARQRGVPLIVDAAAAIGSEASQHGSVGQQGDVEVFSFHATKVFGIGEGAAIFSAPRLETALREASNFGIRYPDVVARGQNSKLSDFQAAVGLAVLGRIDGFVQRRREIAQHYHRALAGHAAVQQAHAPTLSPWQSYPLRLGAGHDAAALMQRALELGVELKRGYYRALNRSTYFAEFSGGSLPITDALASAVVCLPVHSDMSTESAERVIEIVTRSLAAG
jgi:dTDP-4-amino-4,6-dideoxygalactose transaminase